MFLKCINPLPKISTIFLVGRKCGYYNDSYNKQGKKKEKILVEDSTSYFEEKGFLGFYFFKNIFSYKNGPCTIQKETLYLLKHASSFLLYNSI